MVSVCVKYTKKVLRKVDESQWSHLKPTFLELLSPFWQNFPRHLLTTKVTNGKKSDLFVSQAWIKLGTCITILGFLNFMHNGKIIFLNFREIQKMLAKTIPQIRRSQIKSMWWRWRMKSQKSRKPEVFHLMTQILILTHIRWRKKGWRLWLSLSLDMEDDSLEKTMGFLISSGVIIGFLTRLKWLESTKGLGHLI